MVEGGASKLSYIEVENAPHLGGAELPPSQVVRTIPRGGTPGAAPPLAAGNVPPIAMVPAAGDRITYDKGTVIISD